MKVVIFEDSAGEFRWHLKARNGRKIADGGEGYKTRSGARRAVRRAARAFAFENVPIVDK
ncbi:MAG TPA: DUF1508 domain-containing protein [Pyrinomonadaceae bacterium]|jgi:uncharacterized protein YegP (UPF0339 family)